MFKIMLWNGDWRTPYVSTHATEALREFQPRSATVIGKDRRYLVERLSYQRIQDASGPSVMLLIAEDAATMHAVRGALIERRRDLDQATAAEAIEDWVNPWLAVEGICRIVDRIGPLHGASGVPATGSTYTALTMASAALILAVVTAVQPAAFPWRGRSESPTKKVDEVAARVTKLDEKVAKVAFETATLVREASAEKTAASKGERPASDLKVAKNERSGDDVKVAAAPTVRLVKEIAANPAELAIPIDLNYVTTFHHDLKFTAPADAKTVTVALTSPIVDAVLYQDRPIDLALKLTTLGGKSLWSGKTALTFEATDPAKKTGRVTATIEGIPSPTDPADRTCVLTIDNQRINRSGYRGLDSTLFVNVMADE